MARGRGAGAAPTWNKLVPGSSPQTLAFPKPPHQLQSLWHHRGPGPISLAWGGGKREREMRAAAERDAGLRPGSARLPRDSWARPWVPAATPSLPSPHPLPAAQRRHSARCLLAACPLPASAENKGAVCLHLRHRLQRGHCHHRPRARPPSAPLHHHATSSPQPGTRGGGSRGGGVLPAERVTIAVPRRWHPAPLLPAGPALRSHRPPPMGWLMARLSPPAAGAHLGVGSAAAGARPRTPDPAACSPGHPSGTLSAPLHPSRSLPLLSLPAAGRIYMAFMALMAAISVLPHPQGDNR